MGVILGTIEFKNLQEPPASAQNLNLIQSNTQKAITELETNVDNTYQKQLVEGDGVTIDPETNKISVVGSGSTIITTEFSKSVTQAGYSTGTSKLGTLEIPDGYSFIGFLSKNSVDGLNVSYYLIDDSVKANYRNDVNASVTATIGCTAVFMKI